MEPETFGGRGGRHVAEDAFHDRRIGRAPGQRRIADQRVAFAGVRRFVVTVLHDVSFAGGGLREGHDTAQRQDIPRERLGDVRQIVFIIGVEIGAAEVHEQGLTCSLRTLLQIDGPVRRAVVERDGQLSQSVQVAPRVGLGGFDPQFVHAGFADKTDTRQSCPFPMKPTLQRRSASMRSTACAVSPSAGLSKTIRSLSSVSSARGSSSERSQPDNANAAQSSPSARSLIFCRFSTV